MRNLKEMKVGVEGKIQGNEIHNLMQKLIFKLKHLFTEETLERFEWVEK